MITIREYKAGPKVALVGLEANLRTHHRTYAISSEGPLTESKSAVADTLFGGISWPVSRFRLPEGLLLEQQMFLPHDGSTVAMSWSLRGSTVFDAQLVVRPFFSGCGPRSYRDIGFHSEDEGGRLSWLPNVRGPKVFADTNGYYRDEPVRLFDCLRHQAAAPASEQDVITPGSFEFELGSRPSVLILSIENYSNAQRDQHMGVFLAGLMQENCPARSGSSVGERNTARTDQLVAV